MATQAIISAPWLDKVVIYSGHQHLRVGPDRQPRLVPPDKKAAVRRICVATRSKAFPLCYTATLAGRFLWPLVGRPACHCQTAGISFQLSP